MASLSQVRDRADTFFTNVWPTFQTRQEDFLAQNGRFWQGLRAHVERPNHKDTGFEDKIPDRLAAKPTNERLDWRDMLPEIDTAMPHDLQVDVYESPRGHGYVVTLAVRHNGILHSRSVNVGPETHRNSAWQEVTEDS